MIKIGSHADVIAKNLFGHLKEALLLLVLRRDMFLKRVKRRNGQGAAVDFPVLGQGDVIELHHGLRNHIGRLAFQDEGFDCFEVELLIADDISGKEGASARRGIGIDGRVFHAGEVADYALDFAHFDAEATDFHLAIFSADEIHDAVFKEANYVAGVIHLLPHTAFEGVIHEGFRILFRTVFVAAGDLRTSYIEEARHAIRKRAHLLV